MSQDTDFWFGKNMRTGEEGLFPGEIVVLITSKHGYNKLGDIHRDRNICRHVYDLLLRVVFTAIVRFL